MKARVALLAPVAALLVGCDLAGTPPTMATPAGPSAITAASTADVSSQVDRDVIVNITDACDADTFNDAGFGHICDRSGGVKFDQFIAILTRLGFIEPWQFAPSIANVQVGQTFVATNQGGETHTFTQVADFGGGFNQKLNELSHNPLMVPECDLSRLEPDDFVAPGETYRETIDRSGTLKFQCCIHPWMRLEASSR